MLGTALSLLPRSTGTAGSSHEDSINTLASEIEERLPSQFDIEKAMIDFPVRYEESMNTVLTQELLRFNKLTATMKRSLAEIQRALKGLVLMSSELEDMASSMSLGRVPSMWATVAYPSLKPCGSWVVDLLKRLNVLKSWSDAAIAPNIFWISGA